MISSVARCGYQWALHLDRCVFPGRWPGIFSGHDYRAGPVRLFSPFRSEDGMGLLCNRCENIAHDLQPHPALCFRGITEPNGALHEHYRCRICDTHWVHVTDKWGIRNGFRLSPLTCAPKKQGETPTLFASSSESANHRIVHEQGPKSGHGRQLPQALQLSR